MRLILLCLMTIFSILAKANEIETGMPLTVARKLLIAEKWQPVNVHKDEKYKYIGIEKILIKKNLKELENCAIDRPYCIFNYKKADKCLRLIAFGEKIKDMKIVEWKNDCPDSDEKALPRR